MGCFGGRGVGICGTRGDSVKSLAPEKRRRDMEMMDCGEVGGLSAFPDARMGK